MGAKLEEKVLRSIAQYRQRSGRYLLSYAENMAGELIDVPAPDAGRRCRSRRPAACAADARPSAISICWSPGPNAAAALERFVALSARGRSAGARREQGQRQGGPRGPAGGRARAAARKLRRGHAIFHRQQGPQRRHPHARREDGPQAQRIRPVPRGRRRAASRAKPKPASTRRWACAWIPPELRENCGEIEARRRRAACRSWSSCAHIRGDLHMHTTETDGRATLEEMAAAARERGYEYIAITDHSKALAMANGLDEARAVAFAKQVREINRNGLGIRVFSGLECDILQRRRAWISPNDALARTRPGDRQRAQPHESGSGGDDGPAAARARMPASAHPGPSHRTHAAASRSVPVRFRARGGRSRAPRRVARNQRQPRAARSERRHGRAPPRPRARSFTISTDAHHPKHLANMRYGVLTARRGWLGPHDIMNTLPADAFAAALRKSLAQDHENHLFTRSLLTASLFHGHGRRSRRPEDGFHIKRSVVRHRGSAVMMAVDDEEAHPAGAPISACPPASIFGSCRPARWTRARSRCRPRGAN